MKREDLGPLLKGDRPTKTNYEIVFQRESRLSLTAPDQGLQVSFSCIGLYLSNTRGRHMEITLQEDPHGG